ncbi:hypothetical protein [Mucilaginibacter sp. UYCu711]|uniref:hypothetical protein n=1 Tax=Mucilaginibacter sp. UYCu711 TaxID=3156339 RepID=UPI003D237C02
MLAPQSTLYIYADGPKSDATEEQRKNITLVSELIKNETRFQEVIITQASSNQGLANSIIAGVTAVVNANEKVIVLEDDMITSSAFLTYMNDSLHKFKDQDIIGSINAFVDPYNNFNKLDAYFLLNGADCWGWATWKNRWDDFIPDALLVKNLLVTNKKLREFDYGNTISMLDSQINGVIDSWHIRWHGSQVIKERFGLFPNKTFVLNIGTDGSGTHLDAYNNYNGFEVGDLNLYNISIHTFDFPFLLKNHKTAEQRFKKVLLKNMKGSHLFNLRNMIIRRTRLLLGKSMLLNIK